MDNVIHYNNPIECLDLHLLEITLNSYRGTLPEIIFARFFVVRASVLKVMRFALHLSRKTEWLADQRRRIRQNGKASAEAEFHFGRSVDRVIGSHYVKPIHDLSVADPFAEMLRFRNGCYKLYYQFEPPICPSSADQRGRLQLHELNFISNISLNLVIFEFEPSNSGI